MPQDLVADLAFNPKVKQKSGDGVSERVRSYVRRKSGFLTNARDNLRLACGRFISGVPTGKVTTEVCWRLWCTLVRWKQKGRGRLLCRESVCARALLVPGAES